jgi:hypothetical protein
LSSLVLCPRVALPPELALVETLTSLLRVVKTESSLNHWLLARGL